MARLLLAGWLLLLLGLTACDDPKPSGDNNSEENPCGDACPIEECNFGRCTGGNNGDNNGDTPDMVDGDLDVTPDMADVVEDAVDDASDVPDVTEDEPDMGDDPDLTEDEPDLTEDEPDMGDEPDMEQEGCVSDNDCIAGQICDDSLAPPACRTGCRLDDDCLDGQICDEDTLGCIIGCRRNDECPQGEVCNRRERQCVPGDCGADEDCPAARYCDLEAESSVCLPGCRVGDCPQGQYCRLDDRQCADGCATDAQCETAQYCELSLNDCVEGCRDDAGCELGQTCQRLGVEGQPGLTRQQCAVPTCTNDATCPEGFFCEPPGEEPGERFCLQGCRLTPDDCPQDSFCDPQSRQCRPEGCLTDEDCPDPAQFCDANTGACMDGCRDIDGACGVLGEVCDLQARACTCALGQCASGTVCGNDALCLPSCVGQEGACADGTACDTETGLCVPSCASDLDCDMAQFCDMAQAPPQCAQGCRFGMCPQGLSCSPTTRLCETGCQSDQDCAPDSYCDGQSELCVVGCRVEPDNCAQGSICQAVDTEQGPRQQCVDLGLCATDEDCDAGEFCGEAPGRPGEQTCQEGCRTAPDNCAEGFSCDPALRRCGEACEDTEDCGGSQRCILGRCVVPGPCGGDEDCAAGTFCDVALLQPVCKEGCRAEPSFCPDLQQCDTFARRCTDACQADEDCPQGLRCDGELGLCLGLCQVEADCQNGELCTAVQGRQLCLPAPTCLSDANCPEDTFCAQEAGLCQRGCRVEPGACPQRSDCNPQSRQCETIDCALQRDCPAGMACQPDGDTLRCTLDQQTCQDTFDCDLGLICQLDQRQCRLPCQGDEDCGVAEFCDINEGQCLGSCGSSEDCPEGLLCLPDGERQRCLPAQPCQDDTDCDSTHYCSPPRDLFTEEPVCLRGCRQAPDSCGDGLSCHPQERTCQELPCQVDEDCLDGLACVQTAQGSLCRAGCRDEEDCDGDEFCTLGRTCTCLDSACPQGQRCNPRGVCAWVCDQDTACPGDMRCDTQRGTCAAACQGDDFCGLVDAGLVCDEQLQACLSPGCQEHADCGPGSICSQDQRCEPGCEPGTCPEGTFCDTALNQCAPLCTASQDCPQGQFCQNEDQRCTDHCDQDSDCPNGDICVVVASVEGFDSACVPAQIQCTNNNDCDPGQRCEPQLQICVDLCATNQDCPQGQLCQDQTFLCVPGCQENLDCEPGFVCAQINTVEGAATACEPAEPGCTQDSDCGPVQFCDRTGQCAPGCRLDGSNCGPSQVCDEQLRSCAPASCLEDPDVCQQGTLCQPLEAELSLCLPGCQDDSQCGSDCNEDLGLCACTRDSDCFPTQRCSSEGICLARCQNDLECLFPEICTDDGYCALGCRDDEREPNDTPQSSLPLEPGAYQLQLCSLENEPSLSQDCFAVSAQAGQSLSASTSSQVELRLALYSPQGQLRATSQEPGGQDSLSIPLDQSGDWTLCVEPELFFSAGPYNLVLDLF